MARNLLYFSLNFLQGNGHKTRVFSQYFSEVITPKSLYREKLQNSLMPGESSFLQEPVSSYIKHRAFPKSMATTVTKSRTLHQLQIVCKNTLAQGLHLRFPARGVVPCPSYFIYYTSDYFKFFWKLWRKKVTEMPKRKMNPPYLHGFFFSQVEEREVWQCVGSDCGGVNIPHSSPYGAVLSIGGQKGVDNTLVV